MSDIEHKIIKYVKFVMDAKGVSLEEIAEKVGLSDSTLSRVFNHQRGVTVEEKYALFDAVGIEHDEILVNVLSDGNAFLFRRPEVFSDEAWKALTTALGNIK